MSVQRNIAGRRRVVSAVVLAAMVSSLLAVAHLAAATSGEGELRRAETDVAQNYQAEAGASGNCRYGLIALRTDHTAVVDDFSAGVFLDFGFRDAPTTGAQYLPLVWVTEDKDGANYLGTFTTNPSIENTNPNDPASLRYWLEQLPGALWTIGNEVERGPDPGQIVSVQGDMHADVYAEAYYAVRDYIKRYDPAARTSVAGLVQVTPLRLAYLDLFWEAHIEKFGHPPEVDAWAMHIYILPEVTQSGVPNGIANVPVGLETLAASLGKRESGGDPGQCPLSNVYCFAEHDNMAVFREQAQNMRLWMKEHGQQNKPLLLTEYSLLYPYEVDPGGTCFIQDEFGNCFTPERVQAFMDASLDYLESAADPNIGYLLDGGRLVQQWLWFSVNHGFGAGSVSNLYNHDSDGLTTIRPLGEQYRDRAVSLAKTVNLAVQQAGTIFADNGGAAGADVPIWATFVNNGSSHVTEPFDVTFFADAALTNEIGTAAIMPGPFVAGCSSMSYRAEVTWHDLPPGVHRYWAQVDSNYDIGETSEADNRIRGIVFVDGEVQFLPVTARP